MDWDKIIDAAHADNQEHGIAVQRGKKYSQVATRVERFRRAFGAWGLTSEILHFGAKPGEPVVVKAFVTDEEGRVIATGHAFEVVGQGNVNRTSALENAETSAFGRALAALGLHGGEMASLNEIEGVSRKEQAQAVQRAEETGDPPAGNGSNTSGNALKEAWGQAVLDRLPKDATAQQKAEAFASQIETDFLKYRSAKGLENYWHGRQATLSYLEAKFPDLYANLLDIYAACESELKGEAA